MSDLVARRQQLRLASGALLILASIALLGFLRWHRDARTLVWQLTCTGPLSSPLPPRSIEELVDEADLIVHGEVTNILDPIEIWRLGNDPPHDSFYETPIQVEVQRTYLGDADHDSVTLIRQGYPVERDRCDPWPFPRFGDEYLFFLAETHDSESAYALSAPCRQIRLGLLGPTCANGDRSVEPFMQGLSSDEFVVAVEREIALSR